MKTIPLLISLLCLTAISLHAQADWHIAGNAGTNSGTNFIGTKDTAALKFRTNNAVRMTIKSSGKVGIGTTNPKSNLDVAGTILGFDSYFGKTYPISAGTSGASYSSVGYGLTFTDTTANYRYRINGDFSSMLSFRSGGFDFNTAPIGTAGSIIPYTTSMTILQNGNVGIGTNTPAYKLYVTSPAPPDTYVALIENTGNITAQNGLLIRAGGINLTSANIIGFERPNGVKIGSVSVTSTGVSYNTTSDRRLKNIIGTSQKGLADLMKIKIYDYTFKSDPNKKVQTGFMAQELYEIFPQSVSKPGDNNEPAEKNPWTVDYGSVTPLIIKAVQEQQQTIDELKKQISELKALLISQHTDVTEKNQTASSQ